MLIHQNTSPLTFKFRLFLVLILSRICHSGKVYNNIIVSNDSNEEDALLNSAVESSGNHPDDHANGGHGHSGNSTKGGQLKHEAASGGPSSGSKDIVLSTNGSRTKIIVRKAKGSAKRSALDSYRRTQSRQDSCSCSQKPANNYHQEKEVVPVFVPFCGADPMQDPAAAYGPQLGTDATEESRRLDYYFRQPFLMDPLIMAGISPAFAYSQQAAAAQFAAARNNLRMKPFRQPNRMRSTQAQMPNTKPDPAYFEEGESSQIKARHSIQNDRPISEQQTFQRRENMKELTPEEEHRQILHEMHYRQALASVL